ncbi:hypothetical protein D3C85_1215110 [compost metagenome]
MSICISSLIVEVSEAYQISCPNPINNCTLWKNKASLFRTHTIFKHGVVCLYSKSNNTPVFIQPSGRVSMPLPTTLFNTSLWLTPKEFRNKNLWCCRDIPTALFVLNHANFMLKALRTNWDRCCNTELQGCVCKRCPMVMFCKVVDKLSVIL